MSHEHVWWIGALGFGVWCWAWASAMDRRWTRWALSRAAEGPAATLRLVRRSQLRWLGLWLVVWVLSIALAKNDPDHREAAVVVVPMVLAHGPRAFWHVWTIQLYLIRKGADVEIARAVTRGGYLPGALWLFVCLAALAITFRG